MYSQVVSNLFLAVSISLHSLFCLSAYLFSLYCIFFQYVCKYGSPNISLALRYLLYFFISFYMFYKSFNEFIFSKYTLPLYILPDFFTYSSHDKFSVFFLRLSPL